MPDGEHPIHGYITQLARHLHLPPVERDQVLAEVRGHLEERAGALQEKGLSPEQAERQAVQAFGPVRRISRDLRASHPTAWGQRRWIAGIATGAIATWALWLVGTVPVTIYYFKVLYPTYECPAPVACYPVYPSPDSTLILSSPLGPMAFSAYLTLGWLWVSPLLVLYLIPPFVWGRRAQHWWMPGLAYGLGTWLSAPWFVLEFFSTDSASSAEGRIIALALPLALLASFVGWLWRERSASALARTQAA